MAMELTRIKNYFAQINLFFYRRVKIHGFLLHQAQTATSPVLRFDVISVGPLVRGDCRD